MENQDKNKNTNQLDLSIEYPGNWFIIDQKIKVYLNEELIGVGSTSGIDLKTKIDKGRHQLKLSYLRTQRFDFETIAERNFLIKLKYSRLWGNFAIDYMGPPV